MPDTSLPTTQEAEKLLKEHVKDDYQVLHAHMIATALQSYAKREGEPEDLWYITGLLHDLDYFEFPNEHPHKELKWFKEWGYPEELIHAVAAHGPQLTGVNGETKLAKVLYATDELSGFIYAYSLMRPGGFDGMKPKSINKKLKDKGFARKVNREEVYAGLEEIEDDRNEFIAFLIEVYSNMDSIK